MTEENTMADETTPTNGVLRRTILKASALGVGAFGMITPTIAHEGGGDEGGENTDDGNEENGYGNDDPEVDEPDGFEVEILAPHAPFPDELAAKFCLEFADEHDGDPIRVELDDASTCIFAEVTWTEDGTSGWHRHPGVVLVTMAEGEIEVTWERDCVPRTYAAGESFFDPGEVHNADSEDGARAYATFLGIPDGEPATEWVPPVEC